MLNELDLLSQNIGRLIAISGQHQQRVRELESQLAQVLEERDASRTQAEALRGERDALRLERDALSSKIDDAQVRPERDPRETAAQPRRREPARSARTRRPLRTPFKDMPDER